MRKSKTFRPDRIGSYFRMEWLLLALVTASGLIYNVGLLATPWFEGRLAQCLADILGGNETAAQMAVLVLAYIAVTLLVQAARFIKRFYVRRFANNINRRMKGVLYANLVRQSRVALEQEGAGELMTKAISDVDDCVEGMRKFTTEIFDTGVALAGYAVMLLDEITANLDAETEERVLDALRQASRGRTVLSVSHRVYESLGGRTVEIKARTP
jgi:ATP-binding cassette subfamily B multidrug efflux pump